REDVSFADELEFVRHYLTLEQLRLGERLRVREEIDPEALDCAIPSLTLQPLVENAIKYGVAPRAGGGTIDLRAAAARDALQIEVRDDGPGAKGDIGAGGGMGLHVVRDRIATRYGAQGSLHVETAPGEGLSVVITIPAHTGATSSYRLHPAGVT